MLGWLALTLAVALGSALLPVISIEVFLIGLFAARPGIPVLALAAVIAVGQIVGKLFYYFVAKGTIPLPAFLHRKPKTKPPSARRERWHLRTKRIRGWLDALVERCHRHPHWMFGTYSVSSLVGLPPFMATTVLAGLARMRLSAFVTAGFAGRFIRFSVLCSFPALIHGLL